MAINYPTSIDTLTNPAGTDKVSVVDHASQHADANDAVEALQAKVGVDSSAVTTSHDYKLSGVTGSDVSSSVEGTETLTNKTLTSPVLTTPKITTSINDSNGNEVIETPATASAVNHLKITNSATGNDIDLAPAGDDSNVGVQIKGKGTGKVKVGDADLQVPDADGTSGQFLKTDGSAVLGWADAGGTVMEITAGTTHSLTTTADQVVVVWAKGTGPATSSVATIELKYNAVVKDTVTSRQSASSYYNAFALMYTETPGVATQDITVTVNTGSLTNVVIMVQIIG